MSLYWCMHCFSKTDSGGYFWYSDRAWDDVYCPNVSIELAGSIARVVAEMPELFDDAERETLTQCIEGAYDMLAADAAVANGVPSWRYSAQKETGNDLVHQCFILEGLRNVRESGFGTGIDPAWTVEGERASVGMRVMTHRVCNCLGLSMQRASQYGIGSALEYAAAIDDEGLALRSFSLLQAVFPELLSGEVADVRQASFVVRGLASCVMAADA